jgi:hypothetical protein
MRKNLFVILAYMAICYMGCKDIPYKIPSPSPVTSFFPETLGSSWKYRDSVYGEVTDTANIHGTRVDTLSLTITGSTTDFNGKICYNAYIVSKVYGPQMAYYYAGFHTYALYQTTPPWGFTILQLMVDTASAGYTWTSVPSVYNLLNGHPVRTINTIVEKNITRMLNGRVFTNVTHTSTNFQINIGDNGFQNIAHFDFYLAEGVGLIEKDANYFGYLNEVETIIDYNIKTGK